MPAARALCYHAAAAEIEDRPLPGPSYAERDILASLARATVQGKNKKHRPGNQPKSRPKNAPKEFI